MNTEGPGGAMPGNDGEILVSVGGQPAGGGNRRPRWPAALAVAVVVLVAIGGIGLFARRGDAPVVDEAIETTRPSADIAPGESSSLTWAQVPGPGVAPNTHASAILAVEDGFITITESWDANADKPSRRAWRSSDGAEWAPAELTGMDGTTAPFYAITPGGPGFVAVGMEYGESPTAFGPAQGKLLAWTSTDGLAWETHALPPTGLEASDPRVTWFTPVDSVAASEAGIVAAGMAHAELMMEEIVADHLGISLDEAMETVCGYGMGGESFEAFTCPENPEGPFEEELLFEATFDELGLSEEAQGLLTGMSEQALVWYSSDGALWDLLDDPFGAQVFVSSVVAADGGFYAVVHGPAKPAVWRSRDGRSWEPTGEIPGDGGIDQLFVRDGVLYATGWQRDGTALWSSTGGTTWAAIDLDGVVGVDGSQYSVYELHTGGLGMIGQAERHVDPFVDADPAIFEVEGLEITMWLGESGRVRIVDLATGAVLLDPGPWEYREPEPFELELDGYRLAMDLMEMTASLTDLSSGEVVLETGEPNGFGEPEGLRIDDEGTHVFYDPETDEVLLTVPWEDINEIAGLSPPYLRGDEGGIHYIDPDTGEEIVFVPAAQFERAMEEAYGYSEGSYEEPETALLFSPDGKSWSLQQTVDVFGEAGWIESICVGDDVIIAVFRPHGEALPQTEAEARVYEPPPAQWWLGTLGS